MTRDVIIHDTRGRRTCTDADFPLRIGGGTRLILTTDSKFFEYFKKAQSTIRSDDDQPPSQ